MEKLETQIFPSQPAQKHTALFVMFDFDANYIGAEPIKDNSKKEILEAWARCYNELRRAGFDAVLQQLGSETSKMVAAHAEQNEIEIKIAAPGSLRAGPAGRASRALLEHMIG